jgi:hypothetical protein
VVFLRGLLVWLVIVFAEALHGTARRVLIEPYAGDFKARQIAVFTGSVIILVIAVFFIRWLRATSTRQLIGVGCLWVGLTVGFEILLGRLVLGYSWERVASDYNLLGGGLLPIGLLILMLSPLIAAKIRGTKRASLRDSSSRDSSSGVSSAALE